MNTATISAEINSADIPIFKTLLKKFKAKKIVIEEKDDTKMTKEEFYAKIERASKSEKIEMSFEELEEFMLK